MRLSFRVLANAARAPLAQTSLLFRSATGRRLRASRQRIGIGVLALLATSLIGAAPSSVTAPTARPWQPIPLQTTPSVPGQPGKPAGAGSRQLAQGLPARPYRAPKA